MNLGLKRRKIEDTIVAHYNAVNFNVTRSAWVESDTFEDFIFSFFELRRYYETSSDTTVGLEALRVYMDALRALQAAVEDRKLSLDRRDVAGRLIYELNYQMEAVMYEIERNRQNGDDEDSSIRRDDHGGGLPILN